MTKKTKPIFPLAYDIKGLIQASGRGRSTIFEDIAAGRLIARKAGGKTIILYDDAVAWLHALPVREPSRLTSRHIAIAQ
ncbi:DNA-binding protein [Bosea sp. UNC402CLCol]|uniref:DNA-binding protein n=1 Tax=Bosea sp. UNC402CLCol TaxID=1510531 RepID=UPI0012E098DD|nr:DNA-binding protein [Bosea sp. UNC402CLCol]